MTASAGDPMADGTRRPLRAADADRDRVAGILGTAYTEGRLTKDEYDTRLGSALAARTYGDLDELITDLPAPSAPAGPVAGPVNVAPAARTNGYAIASLAFGIGQIAVGPFATIPAIVLGHLAMSRIRRTGERGAGLAITGLILGWGAVILGVIGMVIAIAGMGGMGGMPMR
jgi:Domain of unknown function (DUF1707)/Domain of unknown function (DUF4190)